MVADPLVIAEATADDLDAVQAIEEESFPAPWRREFFASELGAAGRLNLVARSQGKVVGYLFAMWIFDELHINKIAVAETHRRQGIADSLMAHCFEFSRRQGIRSITLEVRQSNDGAQRFYEHLQFKSVYIRSRYYPDGEAAVVMMRHL